MRILSILQRSSKKQNWNIVESQKRVRFDRSHLSAFEDTCIAFESVYYVENPDFNLAMDIQQAVLGAIYARLAADGVKIALPSGAGAEYQTVPAPTQ